MLRLLMIQLIRAGWIIAFIFSFVLTISAISVPLLYHLGLLDLGDIINQKLRMFCHQMPSKTILVLGYPFGLCIRCLAIYLGFSLTTFYFLKGGKKLFDRPIIAFFFILMMFIDVGTQIEGMWKGDNVVRFITGLAFGIGASSLFWCSSQKILLTFQSKRFNNYESERRVSHEFSIHS